MNLIAELESQKLKRSRGRFDLKAEQRLHEAPRINRNANPALPQKEIQIAQTRVYEIEAILQQMQAEAEQNVFNQEQTMQTTVSAFLSKTMSEYAAENNIDLILNWGLREREFIWNRTV